MSRGKQQQYICGTRLLKRGVTTVSSKWTGIRTAFQLWSDPRLLTRLSGRGFCFLAVLRLASVWKREIHPGRVDTESHDSTSTVQHCRRVWREESGLGIWLSCVHSSAWRGVASAIPNESRMRGKPPYHRRGALEPCFRNDFPTPGMRLHVASKNVKGMVSYWMACSMTYEYCNFTAPPRILMHVDNQKHSAVAYCQSCKGQVLGHDMQRRVPSEGTAWVRYGPFGKPDVFKKPPQPHWIDSPTSSALPLLGFVIRVLDGKAPNIQIITNRNNDVHHKTAIHTKCQA